VELVIGFHHHHVAGTSQLQACTDDTGRADEKLIICFLLPFFLLIFGVDEGFDDCFSVAWSLTSVDDADSTGFVF